jgi:cytoskeleton protein RodZ
VLQIGTSLREARERRGLELADVERETRVRARYLRALEEERFDQLPPGAYRRTFLRGYANFLGLDADAFADEYVSRFERLEDAERVALPVPARVRRLPGRGSVALAGAAVLTVALVAWLVPGNQTHHSTRPSLATRAAVAHPHLTTHRHAATRPSPARVVRIVLSAAHGNCWLLLRRGSQQGQPLYEGMLQQGRALALRGTSLWTRIGAPWNLTLTVNGTPQQLPAQTGNVLIDQHGPSRPLRQRPQPRARAAESARPDVHRLRALRGLHRLRPYTRLNYRADTRPRSASTLRRDEDRVDHARACRFADPRPRAERPLGPWRGGARPGHITPRLTESVPPPLRTGKSVTGWAITGEAYAAAPVQARKSLVLSGFASAIACRRASASRSAMYPGVPGC